MKPWANFCVIGHVDHGKTPLVAELSTLASPPGASPKTRVDLDLHCDERIRGITITAKAVPLETPLRRLAVWDCPGHADYVKNALRGMCGCDGAVLVVAASAGVMAQSVEHLRLARAQGIAWVIVYLTGCAALAGHPELLDLVEEEIRVCLDDVGFVGDEVAILRDDPRALLEHLDRAPLRHLDDVGPLRLSVSDVFSAWFRRRGQLPTIRGALVVGVLERGRLRVGDAVELTALERTRTSEVVAIGVFDQRPEEARAGAYVALYLRGIEPWSVRRGQLVVAPGTAELHTAFAAELRALTPEEVGASAGALPRALRHGYRPQCMFGATNVTAYLRAPGAPPLRGGDTGRVELVTRWPTAVEVGETFVLRDSGSTLAIGRVLELLDG